MTNPACDPNTRAGRIRQLIEDAGGRITTMQGHFPRIAVWGARRETDPEWCGFRIEITMPTGISAGTVAVFGTLEVKNAHAAMEQAQLHVKVIEVGQAIEKVLEALLVELEGAMRK